MTCEVCIVCVRTPARVQSTVISAAYCLQLARAAAILVMRNTYIESYGKTHNGYIYIYRHAHCTSRTCGAHSGSPQLHRQLLT